MQSNFFLNTKERTISCSFARNEVVVHAQVPGRRCCAGFHDGRRGAAAAAPWRTTRGRCMSSPRRRSWTASLAHVQSGHTASRVSCRGFSCRGATVIFHSSFVSVCSAFVCCVSGSHWSIMKRDRQRVDVLTGRACTARCSRGTRPIAAPASPRIGCTCARPTRAPATPATSWSTGTILATTPRVHTSSYSETGTTRAVHLTHEHDPRRVTTK